MVLVLGSAAAAAAQEDCQAGEAEEVGLLQGRHQTRSHDHGSQRQPETNSEAEGRCCYGGLGCNYTGPSGCLVLSEFCPTEESCATCQPPEWASQFDLEGTLETYWCLPESLPKPEPTPSPTPYAGPFWTPGSKACYIGVCSCSEATTRTEANSWCDQSCTETEPDGPRPFCPDGKKGTRMTQYCHSSQENCENNCNGHYCAYSPA